MNFVTYDWRGLRENPFSLIADEWMLISAGREKSWNTMTASWGGFGHLWNKDVAFVFIRPTRYTREFVEREPLFSLSFFEKEHRRALEICGSLSGRDRDKVKAAGLRPLRLSLPGGETVPSFEEARLVLACRKLYAEDLKPTSFIDPGIESNYPQKDYHRLYVASLEAAWIRG